MEYDPEYDKANFTFVGLRITRRATYFMKVRKGEERKLMTLAKLCARAAWYSIRNFRRVFSRTSVFPWRLYELRG
jgi:hypothetical protein